MLVTFQYFIIFNLISSISLTPDAAENHNPDIIAAFRGTFQDPKIVTPVEKFYDERISCDLIMDPMETIRTALNQLEVLKRSYCNKQNTSVKEPINAPIKPSGSRSSNIPKSENLIFDKKSSENLAISPKSDIKTTENPNVLPIPMKENRSTIRRRKFFKTPKKKCLPKNINGYHEVQRTPPFIYYEFYDDRETHDGYYKDEYHYDHNNKKH